MKIISFGMTVGALLSGQKTVTRRQWAPQHARRFSPGDLVAAYDHSPRHGGKKVATIRIVSVELSREFSDEDFEREGLEWMAENGLTLKGVPAEEFWNTWARERPSRYRIEFEVI